MLLNVLNIPCLEFVNTSNFNKLEELKSGSLINEFKSSQYFNNCNENTKLSNFILYLLASQQRFMTEEEIAKTSDLTKTPEMIIRPL